MPVVDPGFPKQGFENTWVGGKNLLFGTIFSENCMKMKEIGKKTGRGHLAPLDPPRYGEARNTPLPLIILENKLNL